MNHHARHVFHGDHFFLIGKIHLHGNRGRAALGMLVGDKGDPGIVSHFQLGRGAVKRKTQQSLHSLDGVFEIGSHAAGGVFAHFAVFSKANHGRIQSVGISIQQDIDATPTGGRDDRVLVAQINTHDAHGVCRVVVLLSLLLVVFATVRQ
mmetsp:Transcript_8840/g.24484  ORF Transcript_8840/g.24484 Transcript_8840/m.24484 type:complete len:150 (-) Transcript_8840:2-451(-)